MTTQSNAFYQKLGVKRIINAASWITVYGGSVMPPAVVEAMNEASRWFIDLHELNEKAGEVIARLTGAEAGLVTAGSAAGMLLEAAACMAGSDPARVWQLPDTTGMKNQIIIHRAHRVNYDHNFRSSGATLVEIGNTGTTHEWELESAINDETAAVAYVFGPRPGGALPLAKVIEIAHDREVPVIVDAAAMLPPPENLTRFIEQGADLVSFSGGKGVQGPQSTGILAGRADLIEAAYANSAPNSEAIGRSAKVCKEEIAGLVTALEIFVDTDFDAVQANWRAKSSHVAERLSDIRGLNVEVVEAHPEMFEPDNNTARTQVRLTPAWTGPSMREIVHQLEDGDPGIRIRVSNIDDSFAFIPVNVMDGEEGIVADRLREILTGNA